ncbi:YceD family protein [Streptococcaceae bacterium ESL0687]|nr:YceD family protein [Streptococcaceae bacterium ESL0687]
MQWALNEIKKREIINFDETLNLEAGLKRRFEEIIGLTPVHVVGFVSYEDGLYLLNYKATYTLSYPSTRSLKEVELKSEIDVAEAFTTEAYLQEARDLVSDDNIFVLEKDIINLDESVADNIILSIPTRVLTPEELEADSMPSGQGWQIMSETDFENLEPEVPDEKKSPFAGLDGLFD